MKRTYNIIIYKKDKAQKARKEAMKKDQSFT
jgi:hypothetical protein